MRILAMLNVAIIMAIALCPGEVRPAMPRPAYNSAFQGNYVKPPIYGHPYNLITPVHNYRTPVNNYRMPVSNYRMPGSVRHATEFDQPWMPPTSRAYHQPAPSRLVKFSKSRSRNSRSPCLKLTNPDLEVVLMEVVRRENDNRGNNRREIAKSISQSDVKLCRVCNNGRCSFDHKIVEMAMTVAVACKGNTKTCVCGVNKYRQQRLCLVTARVDPMKRVYDLEAHCERRLPPAKVAARRRHQKARHKARKKARARKRKKKSKRKKPKPKVKIAATPKVPTESEASEEFDVSAEGPDPHERPAPIVEWDEATSQATIVYPDTGSRLDDWREDGIQ